MVHGVKKKTILLIFEYAQVLCILFMNIKITDRFSDVIAALVKCKTSAPITSLRWPVSYFLVSIARANFICRYSRTSRYISFTWVSKRGHLRCANGALAPPCPPYVTIKNTLWICKLVEFWKSESRRNTLLERLGPGRIGVSLLWHRHGRSIKQCSPITYECSELVKQN